MSSKPLLLAATALLIVCTFLTIRQLRMNGEDAPRDRSPQVIRNSAAKPALKAMNQPMKSTERTTAVDGNAPQPGDHAAVHKPAPSVQLADDVQLPAVILALNAAKSDPDFQQPAPIAAAMQGIVDSFYQDLAAGATDQSGDTLLIRPGPDVDRARERANETYRRLFGDEAFNKMIMQAALEARLPVDSGSAGN